ncbi:hypothetical protein [Halomarina oriensis]|uniref:Uncharacterized protein n=1 Tax=Halomarina oriensis TaxID=671145 RepID=A0A6B0GEK3_9EURY|nr:hypothetical protein [Halomarina oriensis]MWG32960.1 hypothetical protein [Halomarina oriensis]
MSYVPTPEEFEDEKFYTGDLGAETSIEEWYAYQQASAAAQQTRHLRRQADAAEQNARLNSLATAVMVGGAAYAALRAL